MAITQIMTDACKQNLLKGDIHFDTDTFKVALYDSTATLNASTAAYIATCTAEGVALTGASITVSNNVAYVDFNDATFSNVTFTARGALIHQTDEPQSTIAVLDFGADKTVTNGTFTVTFPAFNSTSAIIRIE